MLANDSFEVPAGNEVDLSQTFLVYGPVESNDRRHLLLSKSDSVAICSRIMLTPRQVHPATLEDTGNPPTMTS